MDIILPDIDIILAGINLTLGRQSIIGVLFRRLPSQFTTQPVNEVLFPSRILLPADIIKQLERASMLGHQLEGEVELLARLQLVEVYIIHQHRNQLLNAIELLNGTFKRIIKPCI